MTDLFCAGNKYGGVCTASKHRAADEYRRTKNTPPCLCSFVYVKLRHRRAFILWPHQGKLSLTSTDWWASLTKTFQKLTFNVPCRPPRQWLSFFIANHIFYLQPSQKYPRKLNMASFTLCGFFVFFFFFADNTTALCSPWLVPFNQMYLPANAAPSLAFTAFTSVHRRPLSFPLAALSSSL